MPDVLMSKSAAGALRDLLAKGSIDELVPLRDAINAGEESISITIEDDETRRERRTKEREAAEGATGASGATATPTTSVLARRGAFTRAQLETKTKDELLELADDQDIDVTSSWNKGEIIDALLHK